MLKLLNDQLVTILDKYSLPGEHVGTDLVNLISNSETRELIIPVLGMQGMGKSTLINAILREDIMPNEADETTCVPVEVKYGETEEAKVFFLGEEPPVIVHSKAELYDYADNNENPGNSKNVERIVISRKNELLKSGITIVDLPGVGSLTRVNEETTKRYIQNLCSALFVIPTVPAIRKTEALFIKGVWAQFPTAIFVQNRWAGESQEAVDEVVPYNTMRLKQIADQLHNPFDEHIIVINAYDAVHGFMNNDEKQVEESNIGELLQRLELISKTWEITFQESLLQRLRKTLEYGKNRIEERIKSLDKTQEQLFEERKRLLELYEKETSEIKRLLKDAKKNLDDEQGRVDAFIADHAKEYSGQIRARTHQIIDKGTTDGERLMKAFHDYQEEEAANLFESIVERVGELKVEIEKILERFDRALDEDVVFTPSFVDFKKESVFKWEKGLEVGLNLGGAAGGALAYAPLVKAVKDATILGTTIGGPAGAVIGLLASASIYLVVGISAKKLKQRKTRKRGQITKSEIELSIMESESAIKKAMRETFDGFFAQTKSKFEEILKARETQYKSLIEDMNNPLAENERSGAQQDLKYVVSVLDKMND